MDTRKIEILDKIREKITNKDGFEILKQPHTFDVWCGGKYVKITLHAIVDVNRNGYGELFAIDSNYEFWDLDDFLDAEQLQEILYDLARRKKVSVKMEVEVTFDVDGDGDDNDSNKVENLASLMVSDKLDNDLNTCYGDETFVDYNISTICTRHEF